MEAAFSSVVELTDGAFVASGIYQEQGPPYRYMGVLMKFASNGDSLWMRTYQHPPLQGSFSVHWLRHSIEDPDGSIVATGSCNDGQQDLWVIRVDSFGCLVPGCQLYDHIAEQPRLPGEPKLNILLYPNPAADRLFISFRSAKPPNGTFRLLDATGREVRTFQPGGQSTEIELDVRPHPPGLYILHYTDRSGTPWAGKFIKE